MRVQGKRGRREQIAKATDTNCEEILHRNGHQLYRCSYVYLYRSLDLPVYASSSLSVCLT